MDALLRLPEPPRIVLGDANVLYPRIFRDYLLYAASTGIISITWSSAILDETIKHLASDIAGFSAESGELLKRLMNEAYPLAQIDPTPGEYSQLEGLSLPDEGDRHVLAAALAAEANILCTANTKHFPEAFSERFGVGVYTPDELLLELIAEHPSEMLRVHQKTIECLRKATDKTTIEALRKAGAPEASKAMKCLLETRKQ